MTTTSSKDPHEILSRGYVRQLAPDEAGGYVASILEFPGCIAEGETADEALKNVDAAAEAWLEVALAHGQHIREPIDFDGCSGKVALRMPRTLHKQASALAAREGCSLNQLIVTALAHFVGGKELASKLEEMIQPVHMTSFNFRQMNVHFMEHATPREFVDCLNTPLLERASTGAAMTLTTGFKTLETIRG